VRDPPRADGLRTATMMHLAMHDILASVHGRYQPFIEQKTVRGIDPLAAIVEAARVVTRVSRRSLMNEAG
jgi:hypothetical protein